MNTTLKAVQQDYQRLNDEVQILNSTRQKVAFHAMHLESTRISALKPFIFDQVALNEGSGYRSSTGHFIVPKSGLYAFYASAGNEEIPGGGYFAIYMDNVQVSAYVSVYSNSTQVSVSVQAVVHAQAGQSVWVRSLFYHNFHSNYCSFSGILLSAD